MNDTLLKPIMVLRGDNQMELARALGINENTLTCKMKQRNDFKQSEIKIIAERYNLTDAQIKEIFFK